MGGDGKLAIGVDFGTSNSAAAVITGGRISYALADGEPQIPSVVHVAPNGSLVIGMEALKSAFSDPANTVGSLKRLLGRKPNDPVIRALDRIHAWKLVPGPDGSVSLELRGKPYAPGQLVAALLGHLRALGERRFGSQIGSVVITVPVNVRREYVIALKRAVAAAGLTTDRVIHEPVAGAISCGVLDRPKPGKILVADFGGGTFDCSLIQRGPDGLLPVMTDGDEFLGGDDFDAAFADAIAGVIFRKSRVDLRRDAVRWGQLLLRCEAAKRALSSRHEARVLLRDAYSLGGQFQDIDLLVDREWLEPHWAPLVERSLFAVQRLLTSSALQPKQLDEIILIGGTALVPLVKRSFEGFFGRPAIMSPHANLAVVAGAAMVASGVVQVPQLSADPSLA